MLRRSRCKDFGLRSCHLLRAALEAQDREIPAIYGGVEMATGRWRGPGLSRNIWWRGDGEAQASPAIYGGVEMAWAGIATAVSQALLPPWALPFRQAPCHVPAAQLLETGAQGTGQLYQVGIILDISGTIPLYIILLALGPQILWANAFRIQA